MFSAVYLHDAEQAASLFGYGKGTVPKRSRSAVHKNCPPVALLKQKYFIMAKITYNTNPISVILLLKSYGIVNSLCVLWVHYLLLHNCQVASDWVDTFLWDYVRCEVSNQ